MKLFLVTLLALPALALAHPGHGIDGPHWHASDAVGFLALGVAAALVAWWLERK